VEKKESVEIVVEQTSGVYAEVVIVQVVKNSIMRDLFNNGTVKKFILLSCIISLNLGLSRAQTKEIFQCVDNLHFQLKEMSFDDAINRGYGVKIYDSTLFIFGFMSNSIVKVNLKNQAHERILLESDKEKNHIKVRNIVITKNQIICYDRDNKIITHHNWDGSLLRKIKIGFGMSGYELGYVNSYFEYDNINNHFYLPIEKKSSFTVHKNYRKMLKYYQRDGLIGVFDSEGKLIDRIGQYDSIYHSGYYSYSNHYWFSLDLKGRIYLSQELSPKMWVFPIGTSPQFLNVKGANITKEIDQIPKINKRLNNEEYYSALIQSYRYYQINQLNENLYIRKYVDATIDTTTAIVQIDNNTSKINNQCKAPSVREINQAKILDTRQEYMLLFDSTGNVIYDGNSLFEGYVANQNFEFNNLYFWTSNLSPSEFVLRRYVINLNID